MERCEEENLQFGAGAVSSVSNFRTLRLGFIGSQLARLDQCFWSAIRVTM